MSEAIDPIEAAEEKIELAQTIYNATLERYRAGAEGVTEAMLTAAHKDVLLFKSELGTVIATGAKPCPSCGGAAFGMRQPTGFEVGCLNCRDHRARGLTRRGAVRGWNAGPIEWVPTKLFDPDSALGKLCAKLELEPEALPKFVARDPKNRSA
jgi:hypothetical protein